MTSIIGFLNCRRTHLVTLACACLSLTSMSYAEYPEKPLRIVVGTAPGTPIDMVTRIVGTRMAKELGQAIVVENKVGAAGIMAGMDVSRQAADGYNMLNIYLPMAVGQSMMSSVPFDLKKTFQPVGQMVWSYNVLVTHPSVPANSVSELVNLLKANPGKMSFASGGLGSPAQLAGELFKIETKTFATHVPYNMYGQAITDLVGGTHQFMFGASTAMLPFITSGRLKPLAVTSPTRLPTLPNVPTLLELGYKNLVIADWQGLAVKAGTSSAIVTRLNAALSSSLADPEIQQNLAKIGAVPAAGSPPDFGLLVAKETDRWAAVVKRQNLKAE